LRKFRNLRYTARMTDFRDGGKKFHWNGHKGRNIRFLYSDPGKTECILPIS
jgi:hypothetical protein